MGLIRFPPGGGMVTSQPMTPDPDVNVMLTFFLTNVRQILGGTFTGMYLCGSLATGGFDHDSDVDVLVVTEEEVTREQFVALNALHQYILKMNIWCAIQLEVSYIPRVALRRFDPANALHPHFDRGPAEQLQMKYHDQAFITQRSVLREHGVVLLGPPLAELIDPVTPDDLRAAMVDNLNGWMAHFLVQPEAIDACGYQSYTVLTLCRMLYTLEHGVVISKPDAAAWAKATLDPSWGPLIDRAWIDRHDPAHPVDPQALEATLNLICYAIEQTRPEKDSLEAG